ncbi:hypothetical protein HZB04_02075 [Candidatus Wolfebacteria bacterium]|nr:hypothetical protein [Candidatus Wolfebacteria bacterium]
MREEKKIKKIKCPIFTSKNEEIEKINKAINEAGEIGGKARLAERLIKEVDELINCKLFDEKRVDCKICHYIADLRKRTANLILKAKELKTGK